MKNFELCLRTVYTNMYHKEKYIAPSLVDENIVMELTDFGMRLRCEGHCIRFEADTIKDLISELHNHRMCLFGCSKSESILIDNFITLLQTLTDKAQYKLITNAFRIQEKDSAEEIAGIVLRASDLESDSNSVEQLRVTLTKEIELVSLLVYCQKREAKRN